jgi:L-threonylcarbamoyladenylate synthase
VSAQSPVAATPDSIALAARRLRDGALVAFPTETVYGLGADASNEAAVAAIYSVKGRPPGHPLIVHVPDIDAARRWAQWPEAADRLARAFWPGPLTLVLPLREGAPDFATGGQPSIGLRAPSHPVAIALLRRFVELGGSGVAAPSANRFGKVSPTRAQHVADDLGDDAPMVLDGGACEVGVESTIVDLTRGHPVLLRPGGISRDAMAHVLGAPVQDRDGQAPRASGTLASHYAPATPVELLAPQALAARLAEPGASTRRTVVWSVAAPRSPAANVVHWEPAPTDPEAFAQQLYDALRRFDRLGADRILIELPGSGSAGWDAVLDRLSRAAHRDAPAS